jgi:[acyl-carrier-protein] S-malonyltransferase
LNNISKKVLVFAGQGSQTAGMGADLYNTYSEAREVFAEVDEVLGRKLSDIIFNGSQAELDWTVNAQPAMMTVSIAFFRVMQKKYYFDFAKDNVIFAAGHSLGEYTALCAAGALTLADTASLLQKRAEAMNKAVPVGQGGMVSLLGSDIQTASEIAIEASDAESFCEVSNDNSEGQVVLSGHLSALNKATMLAAQKGVKKAVPLAVSAPFHCSLMTPAMEDMQAALDKAKFMQPVIPVVDNVTAAAVGKPEQIKKLLLQQITSKVRWRESVLYMYDNGAEFMLEVGGNGVLSKLKKRIVPDMKSFHIGNVEQLNEFMQFAEE